MAANNVPNGGRPEIIVYMQCFRNHGIHLNEYILDGCQEFIAAGEDGTPEAFNCAACNCHQSFHMMVQMRVPSPPHFQPPSPPHHDENPEIIHNPEAAMEWQFSEDAQGSPPPAAEEISGEATGQADEEEVLEPVKNDNPK